MTQQCRYCGNLVTGNGIYCEAKNKELSESYTKHSNTCKMFEFNEIDAYDLNRRYKPRVRKEIRPDGQISMFDYMKGENK
jgi:hypothetical protein